MIISNFSNVQNFARKKLIMILAILAKKTYF